MWIGLCTNKNVLQSSAILPYNILEEVCTFIHVKKVAPIMLKYPVDAPIDAIQIIVDVIRTKNLSNKATFAEALWNVQGYVQSKAFGEAAGFGQSAPLSDEEACEILQSDGRMGMPWQSIATWALQLGIKLLQNAL